MRSNFVAVLTFCLSFSLPVLAETPSDQTIVVNPLPPVNAVMEAPTPLVPVSPVQTAATGGPPWSTLGSREFGQHYQVYIPMEFKSDSPETVRSWDPSGYPRNGNHLTPQGDACATDADCRSPMGCFARADSGQLPVKICAFPPGY